VSTGEYADWRESAQEKMFFSDFNQETFEGRDFLDFGCGVGTLSFLLHAHGAKSVVGTDLNESSISAAEQRKEAENIAFRLAVDASSIDLNDSAVDAIACFDVMEHIMEFEPIIHEWFRVLRHSGNVLVHWQPYYHPYGHHMQDYLPIPWVHMLLSTEKRRRLCERIVDLPEFNAPWWDRDNQGNKINRFRAAPEGPGFLNRLSMRKFEKICRQAGFRVSRRELKPFSGRFYVAAASSLLTRLPMLRESCPGLLMENVTHGAEFSCILTDNSDCLRHHPEKTD